MTRATTVAGRPRPDPTHPRAARRPRRLRRGMVRPAARPRLLGHGRAAGGRAADGHRPPDRVPDLRAPRLAGLGRAPAAGRARLPDERVLGDLPRRRGRRHGRPRPQIDRLDRPRHGRGHRHGADPGRLGDRYPRRDAFAPPCAVRDPALAARHVGGASQARRRRRTRSRRPVPRGGRHRVRARGRQPLADAPAGPAGRALRAGRRPRDLATRTAGPRLRRGIGPDHHPRLPRAAVAGRSVQGGPRVRHPEHPGWLPLHRPRRAVPGQPVRSVREPPGQGRRARHADGRPVRDPRAAHPRGVHRDRAAPASVRVVDRDRRR